MSANAEPKPAASLSAGLLARKGGARPAMRRQPISMMAMPIPATDDLGWNDMGLEPGEEAPAPAPIPIQARLEAIAERITTLPPAPPPAVEPQAPKAVQAKAVSRMKPRALPATPAMVASSGARKAAFTLRLDAERHLRLRLLSAISDRSAQQLLVEALDTLIAQNDQLRSLAAQVEAPESDRT